MRIWQISDLHFDRAEIASRTTFGDIPKADVAVVIGDLSSFMEENLVWCAETVRPHMPVVYVPGNHDFHYTGVLQASARGRAMARRLGLHYLDQDTVVLDGVRFTGGTFWSDYRIDVKGDGAHRDVVVKRNMEAALDKADYQRIRRCEKQGDLLRPWHTAHIHEMTKGYIRRTLERRFDGPTVVVTHFGSTPLATQPGFENSPTQPSYTSDQTDLIATHRPEMWLHGHVHSFLEAQVADTFVACNPRGYGHETTGFRWDYVHDL